MICGECSQQCEVKRISIASSRVGASPARSSNSRDILLVFGRDRGDHFLLVFEVAIDQPDADPGLGADVVHARLVKAALGKADHRGLEDLCAAIKRGFDAFRGHREAHNE